jgi:hypothetical protein
MAALADRLRQLAGWVRNRFPAGSGSEPPTFFLSRWLFLRLLGCVYLAAFLSLWVQVHGLVGSSGILPVRDYLADVRGVTGAERYYLVPTLCWLDDGDGFLDRQCAVGVLLSLLLIIGAAPAPVLFLLWVLYLSLSVAGQEFLQYQWDALLLETGLLAVFLAPPQLWPRLAREAPPSPLVLWLSRWLLFRLMFGSGVAKLLSGDATWHGLTALQYDYETQPLPTWTSWSMHQLPGWFQAASVLVTFVAEILVPLGVFGPRPCRLVAFVGIVALQVLIAATGNYGFFNLLTVVLCVLLLDDRCFPARWRARLAPADPSAAVPRGRGWPGWVLGPVAAVVLALSVLPFPAPGRPGAALAGLAGGDLPGRGLIPLGQRLRPVRGHDDEAAGDHRGGERRRRDLAAVQFPLEAGRCAAPAQVRRPAPAAAGLANVVCRPGELP